MKQKCGRDGVGVWHAVPARGPSPKLRADSGEGAAWPDRASCLRFVRCRPPVRPRDARAPWRAQCRTLQPAAACSRL